MDWISRNLNLNLLSETISSAETQYRLNLDPLSCAARRLDIPRARDRPKRLTGPLTAPRGARPGSRTDAPKVGRCREAPWAAPWAVRDDPGLSGYLHDALCTIRGLDLEEMVAYERGLISCNLNREVIT